MCLKINFRSFLVVLIMLFYHNAVIFAVPMSELGIADGFLLEPIKEAGNVAIDSRTSTFDSRLNSLINTYLENKTKPVNNVKWYNGKLIVKQEIKPNTNILTECLKRSGTYKMIGRLTIPDVKIDVALFGSNAQEVVDAKDSAAYFKSGDSYIIGDHWYSGFERIRDCKKGTSAFVDTGEKVTEYVCIDVILGHNTGKLLTDMNYNSVMYGVNPNGITLYTCVNGWQNIRIAFFEPKW